MGIDDAIKNYISVSELHYFATIVPFVLEILFSVSLLEINCVSLPFIPFILLHWRSEWRISISFIESMDQIKVRNDYEHIIFRDHTGVS